jgi:hypothetical protein
MNLQRLLFAALLGSLLVAGAPGLRAQNLLLNPDFDSWTDDSTPANWKIENRTRAGTLRSDDAPFPPYSLRIERRSDSTGNNYGLKQDSIPITGGQSYTISCWLKADTMPGGTVHYTSGRVLVTWRSASGGSLGSSNPSYVTSSDWVQQIYVDTAPDTAVMASIMIRGYGRGNPKSIAGGLVYVDHAEFYLGSAVAEESPTPERQLDLQASPNPFASRVRLSCAGLGSRPVRLRIYDAIGQTVREWDWLDGGASDVTWDGRDGIGADMPGGLYFAVAERGSQQLAVRRLLLLK